MVKAASQRSWPPVGPSSPKPRSRRSTADRAAAADHWRHSFEAARAAASPTGDTTALRDKRALGLAALRRQRERLEELRAQRRVGAEAFLILQEELDFLEVTLIDEDGRRIEAS